MGQRLSEPVITTHVASVTKAATANSGSLKGLGTAVRKAHTMAIYLDVTAASGTTPTLDVSLQFSTDGGTTWYTAARFAQVTAAVTRRLTMRPFLGSTEAAVEEAVTSTGTNGVIKTNAPFLGGDFDHRFLYTIGGTNPSFTFAIFSIMQPMEISI